MASDYIVECFCARQIDRVGIAQAVGQRERAECAQAISTFQ